MDAYFGEAGLTNTQDGGPQPMIRIRTLKAFLDDDHGATAIEYALIASLLAVVLVVALTNLGSGLSTEFLEVSGILK
jgi:pilus assembly protein Flp/PilA